MNATPPFTPDPDFEALKAITRLQWLLNFEAVASVPNRQTAVHAHMRHTPLQ